MGNYVIKAILISGMTVGRGWPRNIAFETWREMRTLECNPLALFYQEIKPKEAVFSPLPTRAVGQGQNKNSTSDLLHTIYSLLCHASSPNITEIPTPRSSLPLPVVFLDLMVFVWLWKGQKFRWGAFLLLSGSQIQWTSLWPWHGSVWG